LTIGVIIPFYGAKHKLFRTLESVKKQTLAPDVVVLIDDCGPEPLTNEDERHWQERLSQLVYFYNDHNLGAGLTRNVGMDYLEEKVKYLHFLDSDDEIAENFYEEMVGALETELKATATYSCTQHNHRGILNMTMDHVTLYDGFFQHRPWATCSILWRSTYLKGLRWLDLKSSEDTLFELSVASVNDYIIPVKDTKVFIYQDYDENTVVERNKAGEKLRKDNEKILYAFAIRNIPLKKWMENHGKNLKLMLRGTLDGCREDSLRYGLWNNLLNPVKALFVIIVYLTYVLLKTRVSNA
jgi:glycosyltransferase involved in cell wall biosynthesis